MQSLGYLLVTIPALGPWVCLWVCLWAQTESPAISGGAGWVGAGLLGAVLGWLLWVHLPAKDRQVAALIDSRDALALKLSQMANETERERRIDFKESLKVVVDGLVQETRVQTAAINELRRVVQSASGALGHEGRSTVHQQLLQQEVKGS